MIGNSYLRAQEEKLVLEKHSRNKGKSVPSTENDVSKDTNVSCTVHGMPGNLTYHLDIHMCLIWIRLHVAEKCEIKLKREVCTRPQLS